MCLDRTVVAAIQQLPHVGGDLRHAQKPRLLVEKKPDADVMGEVMIEWQTILCGVDGSEESLHAAKLGAMIAKRLSSRLLGLCV